MIPDNIFLRIAKITGSHGLKGEVKVYVITDIPERFKAGEKLFFGFEEAARQYKVEGLRPMKERILLLKLEGINSRNESDLLKGMDVFIKGADAENRRDLLEEDAFFYYDLIGCAVYLKGLEFGTVTDIIEAGAGDILVIQKPEGPSVMVPFVESMVNTARIKERIIDINPVEGLFDI